MSLTQRQISLVLLALTTVGITLACLGLLLSDPHDQLLIPLAIFAAGCGGVLYAYLRGWPYACHVLVAGYTIAMGIGLDQVFVTQYAPLVLILPPLIALVTTNWQWALGSGVVQYLILIVRAGGAGVYIQPLTIAIYTIILGGLILSRLATDSAQRLADANARAEELASRAELHSRELEKQAAILTSQNTHQQELLNRIAELELPLVPLTDQVLLAPIVGYLDEQRADKLMKFLLHEASRRRVQHVVLDVSGIAAIDEQVARSLLDTAQALRLLGCRVMISGISAPIAMTLTEINVDLHRIIDVGDIQDLLRNYSGMAVNYAGM